MDWVMFLLDPQRKRKNRALLFSVAAAATAAVALRRCAYYYFECKCKKIKENICACAYVPTACVCVVILNHWIHNKIHGAWHGSVQFIHEYSVYRLRCDVVCISHGCTFLCVLWGSL